MFASDLEGWSKLQSNPNFRENYTLSWWERLQSHSEKHQAYKDGFHAHFAVYHVHATHATTQQHVHLLETSVLLPLWHTKLVHFFLL